MTQEPDKIDVGNTQDVRGILAFLIVGACLVVAAIAILKGADPTAILDKLLLLAGVVVGFYFASRKTPTT